MMRRLRGDGGFAALELALWTGLILLPALILIVSLPIWWERHSTARLAAREAARTVVLADDWDTAVARAHQVTSEVAANHQVPDGDLTLTALEGSLDRGAAVSATVTVAVPAMAVPFLLELPAFTVSITHTENVNAYRSFPPP